MMTKINSAQASVVAAKGSAMIRHLTEKCASLEQENAELREKIASRERDDRVREIAQQMEGKGLNADLTFDEKVASIRRYNDLTQIEEAVKMASSGNIKMASVSENTPGPRAIDPFTSFCLGN